MDPQIDDDHVRQARLQPAGRAADKAADGAGRATGSLLGIALAALFVVFLILSVAGVFLYRG